MKKIIALSGISGVGKTHLRTTDPELKNLPALDIADIYSNNPNLNPDQALSLFIRNIDDALHDHDTIVIEAYFRRGSKQRLWLEHTFGSLADIEYREPSAPISVCKERIKAQAGESDDPSWARFIDARLKLLDMM